MALAALFALNAWGDHAANAWFVRLAALHSLSPTSFTTSCRDSQSVQAASLLPARSNPRPDQRQVSGGRWAFAIRQARAVGAAAPPLALTASAECDVDWRMSGDWDEDLCKKALVLVEELCFNSPRGYSQSKRCQEFTYLLRGGNKHLDAGKSHFVTSAKSLNRLPWPNHTLLEFQIWNWRIGSSLRLNRFRRSENLVLV